MSNILHFGRRARVFRIVSARAEKRKPDALQAMKEFSWQNDGTLLVRINDTRLTDEERAALHAIGDRLFGSNGDEGQPQ